MAYKQPRVPEYSEREGTVRYLKALTAFLKDFCMAAWKADTQREKEIGSVSYPVTSVNGKTGDVALDAQDVGALAKDGTAADSSKLGGVDAGNYALKTDLPEGGTDFLSIYPVGSIYMSVTETSPAERFGGTWEQLKDQFLLSAGDSYAAGSTGGEATHTLTESQLPVLSGNIVSHSSEDDTRASQWYNATGVFSASTTFPGYAMAREQIATIATSIKTIAFNVGSGEAHNNMPPYLAVYMWKRVS